MSFLGTELVIANQSCLAGIRQHMARLGLGTGERGQPTLIPTTAGLRAGEHATSVRAKNETQEEAQARAQGMPQAQRLAGERDRRAERAARSRELVRASRMQLVLQRPSTRTGQSVQSYASVPHTSGRGLAMTSY